jgi:NTP pyrophosphatase (non-canonical NTP hydrolase)
VVVSGGDDFNPRYRENTTTMTAIAEKAVKKWGKHLQLLKIQEEAIELALAISHYNCPTRDKAKTYPALIDELADMEIMLEQARVIFDATEIDERVQFKKERLKNILK